jgi:hypothetical protein
LVPENRSRWRGARRLWEKARPAAACLKEEGIRTPTETCCGKSESGPDLPERNRATAGRTQREERRRKKPKARKSSPEPGRPRRCAAGKAGTPTAARLRGTGAPTLAPHNLAQRSRRRRKAAASQARPNRRETLARARTAPGRRACGRKPRKANPSTLRPNGDMHLRAKTEARTNRQAAARFGRASGESSREQTRKINQP